MRGDQQKLMSAEINMKDINVTDIYNLVVNKWGKMSDASTEPIKK